MKRMKRWLAMAMAVLIATSTLAGDYLIATAAELPAGEEVVAEAETDVEADVEEEAEDTAKEENPYAVTVYPQPTEAPTEAPVEATEKPVAEATATPEVEATATPEAEMTPEATVTPEAEVTATPEAVEATPEVDVEATATPEASVEPAETSGTKKSTEAMSLTDDKGLVTIYAPAGVLPEGAYVKVREIANTAGIKMAAILDDIEAEDIVAYDITIYTKNGEEISNLDDSVTVTFNQVDAPANTDVDAAAVYHYEAGTLDQIAEVDVNADEVVFETEHFSIYVYITETRETVYEEYTIEVGETVTLNSNNRGNKWLSSNETVAEITNTTNYTAVVEGLAVGTVTITHSYGMWQSETYIINVVARAEEDDGNTETATGTGIAFKYYPKSEVNDSEDVGSTNTIKFTVELFDKDGNIVNTLPEGTEIPENFSFDTNVLNINASTFSGVSIPGYTFDVGFCYFNWSGFGLGEMAPVLTFKNFGRISNDYPNYNSYIGFTTTFGTGDDYDGDKEGYYAYNPTGTLRLRFRQVDSVEQAYKTYYVSSSKTVGTFEDAKTNGKYYPVNKLTEYSEAYMNANVEQYAPDTANEWIFKGWCTDKDATGNGTGTVVDDTFFSTEVKTDVWLYAKWEDSDAEYTVSWYDVETGQKLAASATRKDLVGATVSVTEEDKKEFANYVLLEEAPSVFEGVVARDGSLELKVYYAPVKTVEVTAQSASYEYNGQEHSVTGFVNESNNGIKVDVDGVTYYVTGLAAEAKGTAVGTYETIVTGAAVVLDVYGNDVTDRFAVKKNPGVLEISKVTTSVTVTITEHGGRYTYDGTEKAANGYDVKISNELYTEDDFTFSGNATVKGTDAGSYDMELKPEDFTNISQNFSNVEFVIVDETLEIARRKVTLTSGDATKVYDGTALTNKEVTVTGDGFAEGEGATYIVTGSRTEVGSSANTFDYEAMAGTNLANYEVTKKEGTLTVTENTDKVTVTITEKSGSEKYDGKEKTVTGYTVKEISNELYTEDDFTFSGNATVKGTDAGSYDMELKPEDFTNTSQNFSNVEFVIVDGTLEIAKREVTLTSGSATKVYDGTALTNEEVTVTGDGYAEGEGATYNVTGSRTVVGISDNDFEYTLNTNTKAGNYIITKEPGKLSVTQAGEVEVIIVGETLTKTYDGVIAKVSGYTVESISAPAKAEDVVYDGQAVAEKKDAGMYAQNLREANFSLKGAENYSKVTFKVTDGSLIINPREVVLTSGSAEKVYDGTALTNMEVTVTGDGFVGGEGVTFDVTGSRTEVGSSYNTFDYEAMAGTNLANYEVTKKEGTLTVTENTDKVTVTITERGGEYTYDGTEKTVEGYEVTNISNGLYTEDDFTFSGNAMVKGTDAGSYDMKLKPEDFTNTSQNFSNVEFVIVDGTLEIARRKVTLISGSAEKVYDGTALTNEEVTVTGDGFAEEEGVKYNVTGSQTEVGSSDNDFTYTLKTNTKAVNYDITPVKGTLTVTPLDTVEITIIGNTFETIYNGAEHKAEGYAVTINDGNTGTYSEKDFNFKGNDVVAQTDAGIYTMGLSADQFENTNPNFTNVVFTVTDGDLKINKRTVTLESATDTKVYDGEALVNDNVAVGGNGFADGEGVAYNVTGSQTEVGSSANAFTYTLNAGTKADNYTITTQEGTLTVTPYEEKITVTITEHGGEYTYDGNEKTVTGYDVEISNGVYTTNDFTFSGNDSVSGTNAGSYDMELTAEDFTNTNTNFTNVEFVIVDAQLVITPIDKVTVTITEKSGTATYDGTEKKVEGYDVSIDNSLYTEADFAFSGEAVAKGTQAGTYDMNVKAEDFTNTNKNFTTVEFVIVDGQLVITASADEVVVMIQENSDSKVYNGQEQSVTGYTVASISNPLYTEADFDFTGDATAKGTEVGTYDMNLVATDFVNKSTDFTNVTFKILDGQLAITPVTDEVVVTITENSGTAVYDGTEKTVTGYTNSISNPLYTTADFTFSGTAVAKGTEVGTYDMEVKASDFTNTSKNFANVTFVVEDGQLEITPATQEVTVTITENSGSFVYDGSEKTVSGYEVTSISNNLYTASDFTFSGTDSVSGTNTGTYDMELTASDFTNTNKNFANVTFVIVDGQLTITPVTDEIVVTITENSATYTYDGKEKTVTGYEVTSISNSLYTENDFTFSGVAEVKGTNAGSYDMAVVTTDFANTSTNFTNVKFVVVDGKLVIDPIAEVTVTITENSGAEVFDGTEKRVAGYNVTSINNSLYTESDFTFNGVAEAKGTNAGSYDMEVKAEDFTNTNANFAKVTFVVEDGQLIITPVDEVAVIITENSATYVYDGTEKSVAGYEVTDISNDLYKETDFSFVGTDVVKGTEVGAYDMLLTVEDFVNENTNFKKVTFTIVDGQLTISPISEEVIVTIKENSGRYTYDGTEKTVEGYEVADISNDLYTVDDFEFNGEAIAKGTDAGTYDMEVKAEDFTNINMSVFENVTFVVEDGELVIDPYAQEVKVQIAGKNDTVLYDGQTHSVKGYDITIGCVSEPETVQLVTLNSGSAVENLLKAEDIKLVGSDEVVQTDAGTYAQGLDTSDFSVENDNFSNVVFEITDGSLEITKRQVTLTSANASKVYDGTALTKKKVTVSGDGFAEGEGATYKVTGKQTQVGESKNKFSYTLDANTLADNYDISTVFGKLTVTPQAVDPTPEEPTPDDPTPSNPTPAPTATPVITIDDDPVPMADGPVPADDDGPAVLGARRSSDPGAAVLGARRGTEYAVLGKRRRPETGDSLELILWYIALGMSVGTAIMAATKVRKTKAD